MLQTWVIVAVSVVYLGLLFAVAFYGDRRADAGRSVINNGTIYALSLAVYATSWTYYGSVGRAATAGVGFLPIYLGPTLMFALGWLVLRRIIRISRRHRITSLADFISARYGKSAALGGLVTIIAVVGIVPYISLQLKAVSNSFEIIRRHPEITSTSELGHIPLLQDTALYAALLLAAFTILFGTRHLDTTERHEGMVAAIAFESVVKLVAFLAAGLFVVFWVFGGFNDLFSQAADAGLTTLFTLREQTGYGTWVWLTVLSMLAIVLLPRQWQITIVENVDEGHLKRAMWLFPLYLLAINVFVLPIAAGGLLRFGEAADADTFVLTLPMAEGKQALALLVFIGGLSAATGMIIVETIALSTMVSNSLVMPLLLRGKSRLAHRDDLAGLVLGIRRATIVLVLLLGYAYFRLAGEGPALVSIGLVSFAAVAQFAPAILGGLFWKGGTRRGVLVGLVAGFAVWAYTLLLPSFADAGLLPASFLREGPLGIELLRPQQLFGLAGMDPISHAMFWSALLNIGGYVTVSLAGRPDAAERAQAVQFVEILAEPVRERRWQVRPKVGELQTLLERFLGREGAHRALRSYPEKRPDSLTTEAAPELVHHAEAQLAGSIGAASARLAVASVAGEEQLGTDEVMEMIGEASQIAALEERHRLARELHDSVSQALFSMTLHARAIELAMRQEGSDPHGPAYRSLAQLRILTQGALAEMRALIFQLRPDVHQKGLVAAVRNHAAAVASREGVQVGLHASEEHLPLDERAEEELFRVIQEALYNSIKHAQPSRIDIRLNEDPDLTGTLVAEVTDDGVGFDPDVPRPGHLGLKSMRERTESLGGRLTINSSPGSTTVRAVLPDILRRARSDRNDG
ncbi:histidine kinase [Streptomyces sp. 7N604]|uniref:histidine kinase n=1 Tax=Streptomyces sp. 7N604 TaxID=3457415 RepID=UPI003FD1637A